MINLVGTWNQQERWNSTIIYRKLQKSIYLSAYYFTQYDDFKTPSGNMQYILMLQYKVFPSIFWLNVKYYPWKTENPPSILQPAKFYLYVFPIQIYLPWPSIFMQYCSTGTVAMFSCLCVLQLIIVKLAMTKVQKVQQLVCVRQIWFKFGPSKQKIEIKSMSVS